MIQINLSGDIHPQPGPNSRKTESYLSGQDANCKENHSTKSTLNRHANSNIKVAHLNVRSLKSREHFVLLQNTIE